MMCSRETFVFWNIICARATASFPYFIIHPFCAVAAKFYLDNFSPVPLARYYLWHGLRALAKRVLRAIELHVDYNSDNKTERNGWKPFRDGRRKPYRHFRILAQTAVRWDFGFLSHRPSESPLPLNTTLTDIGSHKVSKYLRLCFQIQHTKTIRNVWSFSITNLRYVHALFVFDSDPV